ncbi:MAG: arylsulfatase [Opitutaceae bacterium]|nr:arylsulfatase [Opitutaceae bacterium]
MKKPAAALRFALLMAALAVASRLPSASISAAEPIRPPNIIVVLADDAGWGDFSFNGNTNVATPNIDSLARAGAKFDRFFVCPVCAPTRAEFLTGRYHLRGGVRGVDSGKERMNLDEQTIAEFFKAAGYATGAFGKWHNGSQWPYHPNARGFDEYYGFTSGHWGDYFDPPLDHNGQPVRGKGYLADDLTDHAMDFIAANRARPFFCYVPLNTPHSPMQVPDRFYEKFARADVKLRARDPAQEDIVFTRAALAMCENIDWNVGRILQRLDELKLTDNTIVIYFSDNGPNSWRWNGGMKGRKGSTDEGGVRSSFLIRWPGHIAAGAQIPQIAGAIDLLPTLADLARVPLKPKKLLDGVSLAPLLTGTVKAWPDRMIFSHWNGRVSVRTQRHRLDDRGALFDLAADPMQDRDLAKDLPDVATRLAQATAQWKAELLPALKAAPLPFPVGYREFPLTQLPARDGVPHGQVKRSNRFPNSTYFLNWIHVDDRITWDVEVATAGRYEAIVHYACPKADLGAKIELGFKGSRIAATVTESNDPPLRGAEHDRVARMESYVKDFQPFRLGTIELAAGRGELSLRALAIPGAQAMEVRAVSLTLLK